MEKLEIIHGNALEDVKEERREDLRELRQRGYSFDFSDEEVAEFVKAEIPKTPIDLEVIDLANKFTNELLARYGLESIDVTEKNVHILPKEIYDKVHGIEVEGNVAAYSTETRAIYIKYEAERALPTARLSSILHEMIHLKQFQSHQVFEFKDGKNSHVYNFPYRHGVTASSNIKKIAGNETDFSTKFTGLMEAIVSDIEKRINPFIVAHIPQSARDPYDTMEMRAKGAQLTGLPVSEIERTDRYAVTAFAYPGPRQVLDYVVDCIVNDDTDRTKESVKDAFFKANFSGNLLEIGRLIEKTFGEGSFRILGDMEPTNESAEKTKKLLEEKIGLLQGNRE